MDFLKIFSSLAQIKKHKINTCNSIFNKIYLFLIKTKSPKTKNMNNESDFIKTVFGLKLRQQRQKKDWSLQDLADKTKLSKSYLNEIENGKKYPKHDKILQLAEVLNCKFDDLVSTKLDKNLAPFGELLQSDFF